MPRPSPAQQTATRRAAMDPSHRSLALSLGALDEVLDRSTCARLAVAARRLATELEALARAKGESASPACLLLAALHDATLAPEISG